MRNNWHTGKRVSNLSSAHNQDRKCFNVETSKKEKIFLAKKLLWFSTTIIFFLYKNVHVILNQQGPNTIIGSNIKSRPTYEG